MRPRSRIGKVPSPPISRRALLLSSAAGLGCGFKKAAGYQGYCFIANQDSRTIAVVDLNRFRVRKQIPLDAAPSQVLQHPSDHKAFVLAPAAGAVYEIDAVPLTVTRSVRAGNTALSMQMSPGNDALWVLYRDPAELVELPLGSLRPRRRIRLASPPDVFDLSPNNPDNPAGERQAAIASYRDRTITLASLGTGAVLRTIAAKSEPSLLRFRWDNQVLIAGSRAERNVTIFDVPTGKTVVRLPLPIEPRNFCVSADHGQLYITGDGMDGVVVVYPYNTEVGETILAGRRPGAMTVTEKPTPLLLVANPDTDRVTVLDFNMMGKSLVAVVEVGQEPRHLLITPDNGMDQYALVLNEKSGDLAVILLRSLLAGKPYRKPSPVFNMIAVGEKPVSAAIIPWTA
jgi:DNA-binding beta-propeller fold protein YncE